MLLCDEATSALDPKTTHAILELIRDINQKLGITVIIITHQMSVVEEICSHVAILDAGHVVEKGRGKQVFSQSQVQSGHRLVFPGEDEICWWRSRPEARIRVVFSGAIAAGKPLIAHMATEAHYSEYPSAVHHEHRATRPMALCCGLRTAGWMKETIDI